MKIVKLMFTFCCYGDVNVYVMKMAKLPSPMLASVTMCNDKISKWNSRINGIRWFWDILHVWRTDRQTDKQTDTPRSRQKTRKTLTSTSDYHWILITFRLLHDKCVALWAARSEILTSFCKMPLLLQKKQSQEIFSISLFRTNDIKKIKYGGFIPEST